MRNFLLTVIFSFMMSSSLQANRVNNFWPAQLPHDLSQLHVTEIGKAKFSVLFWDIYTSKLYTKSGLYKPENALDTIVFEINYLQKISRDDLIKRTKEQWQYLGYEDHQYNEFLPQLAAIWPDISAGDTLALMIDNGKSQFYFNNLKIGGVDQKSFSQLFLAIWLSPNTSQKSLRKALLGENEAEVVND